MNFSASSLSAAARAWCAQQEIAVLDSGVDEGEEEAVAEEEAGRKVEEVEGVAKEQPSKGGSSPWT